MLLDDYLPEFDVRASHATGIAAPPERVYACLWTADFDRWGLTRALYALRALPMVAAAPRETWPPDPGEISTLGAPALCSNARSSCSPSSDMKTVGRKERSISSASDWTT
jgi:hypothetical protein